MTKLIAFSELALLRKLNAANIIVAATGCFDVLHRGHIDYLERAKALGNVLVVGLNSDRSVRAFKGDGRPVNSESDRAYMLSALAVVDRVVIFDEDNAAAFLDACQPDVWVKGSDYTLDKLAKAEISAVARHDGSITFLPLVAGYSTTSTIAKLKQ